jgi:hypothetical protein
MSTFPTLSVNPSVEAWEEGVAKDPTIKTDFENGFVQTYAAFTRIVDKWKIGYRAISTADKDTLRTFEKTVKVGSDIFRWTNPVNNTAYSVRFEWPITYKMRNAKNYWDVDFVLIEV